jgi:hypothetical protein
LEVRELAVLFLVLALSSMSIWTVRMSPTRLARWSLKKARAPTRHSELAEAAAGGLTAGRTYCWVIGASWAG